MSDSLTRLRIYFSKTAPMRFTSHLDLHRTWERSFRRARLPLAYSQGYNPQARLNLASALPLGFTSQCEILDVWLENPISETEIENRLIQALPPGLTIDRMQAVVLTEPALQTQIDSAEYQVSLNQNIQQLETACENLLQSPAIPRLWRGKKYDLRPLILDLKVLPTAEDGRQRISVRLNTREGATGRPDEVAAALGIDPYNTTIHRTALFLNDSW